jgi:hypothetical protein
LALLEEKNQQNEDAIRFEGYGYEISPYITGLPWLRYPLDMFVQEVLVGIA